MLGAGLVHVRHVAAHVVGVVEQEGRQRVGHVVAHRGGVGRRGRAGAVVAERAARAAEVLRLQQEVAVASQVGAELHLVVAGELGQRRRHRVRRLATVPRHRVGEPDHRVAVVLDVHRHDAAGVVADVHARHAQLLRRVEPLAFGCGHVVVPGQAAAHFHHQRVGPRARPVQPRHHRVVRARPGEPAVGRTAHVAGVRRGVDHHGTRVAEARRQLVAGAHLPVDLDVELVGLALADARGLVVRLADRLARQVRQRHQREHLPGNGADPAGRHHVVGKRRAVVARAVAGERVADDGVGGAAEVAVAPLGRRHEEAEHTSEVVVGALVVAEVEQLVLADRAADREAELVVADVGLGRGVVGRRVEALVAREPERAAAQVVGARLERDVGDRAAGAPELGVVVGRAHRHRLERLGRRDQHRQQARAVVVVEALDLHVVGQTALAVDLALEASPAS